VITYKREQFGVASFWSSAF